MKKVIILPLALTALLLTGCNGTPITREEAIALAETIDSYYASDDFVFPQKYSIKSKSRMLVSASIVAEQEVTEIVDLQRAYYYVNSKITMDDESEYSKTWIYYQVSNNKTYLISDYDNTRYRFEEDGNSFLNFFDYEDTLVFNIYSYLHITSLISLIGNDDERNVYRSSGEGSLYFLFYMDEDSDDVFYEVSISNYLITLINYQADENSAGYFEAKYSGFGINKPNPADYPLADISGS